MIISPSGRVLAEIEIKSFAGRPTLGGYALVIHTELSIPSRQQSDTAWLRELSLEVSLNHVLVGVALPDVQETYYPRSYDQTRNIAFRLFLSQSSLEAIERERLGHNLTLAILAHYENGDAEGQRANGDAIVSTVSQSDWLSILRQMGYGAHIVWEVPVGLNPSSTMTIVLEQVEKAKKAILQGEYRTAVTHCRQSIEAIEGHYKGYAQFGRKDRSPYDPSLSKEDRVNALYGSVRHLTHLSVHPDKSDLGTPRSVEFSRAEAIMLLGTTIALASALPAPSE